MGVSLGSNESPIEETLREFFMAYLEDREGRAQGLQYLHDIKETLEGIQDELRKCRQELELIEKE